MSIRELKGQEIAKNARIVKNGNLYVVPSQSGRGKYTVDAEAKRCSCPDFDFRQQPCKHIFAVELTIRRERKTTVKTAPNGQTTTTTTETVTVKKKTYAQPSWPAYHASQVNEKRIFLYLLHQLCQGVGSPAQYGRGQRRLPLEDMIFAMAFKVYSTLSTRRFMTDLRDAQAKGYLSSLPCYNSVINYFDSEMVTDYLKMLIEESSLPLASIESDFAVDSSGLSTSRFVQWFHAKYTDPHLIDRREWVKVHLCCGVKTNVVTAVEMSEQWGGDSPYFKPLVEATSKNFLMNEISADKAYLSDANLKTAVENNATPLIPFKTNSGTNDKRKSQLWRQMYHYFAFNQERFMERYHKRSNVETTFMMIKSKFGDSLRSKTKRAMVNEALCKVLCHNICCLISAMYELGLKPKFYSQAA